MFKGKLIDVKIWIQNRRYSALLLLFFSVIPSVASENHNLLVWLLFVSLVALTILLLIVRRYFKRPPEVIGTIQISKDGITIVSSDGQETFILSDEVEDIRFTNVESPEAIKWWNALKQFVGMYNPPGIRLERGGTIQEYYFSIDSEFMFNRIKDIASDLNISL